MSSTGTDSTPATIDVGFSLDSAPDKNWEQALACRTFKEKLTVCLGGKSVIEAAKVFFSEKCYASVIISGLRVSVSNVAKRCFAPQDLPITFLVHSTGCVSVRIHDRYESINESEGLSIPCDTSWAWRIQLVDLTHERDESGTIKKSLKSKGSRRLTGGMGRQRQESSTKFIMRCTKRLSAILKTASFSYKNRKTRTMCVSIILYYTS